MSNIVKAAREHFGNSVSLALEDNVLKVDGKVVDHSIFSARVKELDRMFTVSVKEELIWCKEMNQSLTDRINLLEDSGTKAAAYRRKRAIVLEYQSDLKANLPNLSRPSIEI